MAEPLVALIGPADARGIRVASAAGLSFEVWPDGFPRVRDLDIGARIGLSRPRDFRKVVQRMAAKNPEILRRDVAARSKICGKNADGTPRFETGNIEEYWLTRAQALKAIARCETDIADAILDEMVAAYEAVLDGLLVPAETTAAVDLARRVDALERHIAKALTPVAPANATPGGTRRRFVNQEAAEVHEFLTTANLSALPGLFNGRGAPAMEMYEVYARWLGERSTTKPLTITMFGRRATKSRLVEKRKDHRGTRYYALPELLRARQG